MGIASSNGRSINKADDELLDYSLVGFNCFGV